MKRREWKKLCLLFSK